jgi:hypothetical protein
MYTSTNLLDWIPASNPKNNIQYMWRPKVAKPNGSWYIYGQVDRNVQALKSPSIDGSYSVNGGKVPLPPSGYTYSDTGMFHDDADNTWYLLTSADHNTVQINRINADGTIGDRVNYLAKGAYEAPGILKVDGIYYLIVSGKTGWRSNPNQVFWTNKLVGGSWNGPVGIAPEDKKTYNSQNTFELTVQGSKRTTHIYMGDSWDSKGGPDSNHVWLPIAVDASSKKLTLEYHAQWRIDVKTGEVQLPTLKRRYEAEDASLVGRAEIGACAHCVSKRGVGNFDDGSAVVFANVTAMDTMQWVQVHYRVEEESRERGIELWLQVNGGLKMNVSSLNHRAGWHDVVPVQLVLEKGDGNVIAFGANGGGITLDGIEVVED